MKLAELKTKLSSKVNGVLGKSKNLVLIGPLPINQESEIQHKVPDGVIYIDGGLKHKLKLDQTFCNVPTLSLGDGDSIAKDLSKKKLDFLFPPHKDQSDLSLALECLPPNCNSLELYGFYGGRQDHFLCNLGEIHHYLTYSSTPKEVKIFGNKQTIIAVNNKNYHFKCSESFSVLSLVENTLTINGECEYTCHNKQFASPMISLGLSNKGFGEVIINFKEPIFIITNYE
jgi:thiamine pyrophosphokinase